LAGDSTTTRTPLRDAFAGRFGAFGTPSPGAAAFDAAPRAAAFGAPAFLATGLAAVEAGFVGAVLGFRFALPASLVGFGILGHPSARRRK
jgi:hypothetical protein